MIQAALACFIRKGYVNTSMDDIAAESGLSKGSLYWYFPGKEELFVESLKSVFSGLGEEVASRVNQHSSAGEKLQVMADAAAEFGKTSQGYFSLFIEYWAQSSDRKKAGELWKVILEPYKQLIGGIIREGVRKGEFRSVKAEPLAWALMAAYDGLATYQVFMPDLNLTPVYESFARFFMEGLRKE